MKRSKSTISKLTVGLISIILLLIAQNVNAQMGSPFSVGYTYFPYANLANPNTEPINGERNFEQDLEIKLAAFRIQAAYPFVLTPEKTLFITGIAYDRLDISYKNWNTVQGGSNKITQAQSIELNLMLMHQLSPSWSLLAFVTPGLASDFEGKLAWEDFSYEGAIVFIHKFSDYFSLGGGFAYSRQFGEPYPLPVIALEWNNGSNLKASAILPVSMELWYLMSNSIELGLVFAGDGNQYHGDPNSYEPDNPQLRYSLLTLGPAALIKLTNWLNMRIDGGFTLLRRFEFFDGDNEEASLDLKNVGFVKVGFELAM
ncbi:DUF6268 family outer membrane beta-barrel protein [Bacteroidota bacterium]